MLKRLPRLLKNFFFLSSVFFLIWMFFLDSNDFLSRHELTLKRKNLEDEKAYYLEKIEEVKKEREALLSNRSLLEKFAREKYLMKKDKETLFVIVEEDNK